MVAAEAGVGAATAYTYFSSKEHLVAEVFWRRLASSPPPPDNSADPATRAVAVLRHVAVLLSDEPQFGAAVTTALLGRNPDVEHLQARIGREIRERLAAALGPAGGPAVVDSLLLLWAGALVYAGMGYASYAEIADRLDTSARLIMRG
jgi:TetR/AcrR family transcriptional regulator, cholesterol catabolism regulator